MKTKDNYAMTINRQIGIDDQKIGAELARQLHIRFVDHEILSLASKMLEVDKGELEKLEQKSPTWWEDFVHFNKSANFSLTVTSDKKDITTRELFYAQADIIKLIADIEPCVFLGRCAFEILNGRDNLYKIYLYDNIENRAENVMKRYLVSKSDALKMIERSDRQKENYVKSFTGKDWSDARNYDLSVNVGVIGMQKTVETILKLLPRFVQK